MNFEFYDRLHTVVAAGRELVDDKTASIAPEIFGRLEQKEDASANPELIKAGTRINWNGTLKRAVVDLWDIKENNPDNAPTLWEDVAYKLGYRIAPEVFTSTNAAMMGEKLWFGDMLYESLRDGNVWPPSVTPEWWKSVSV